VFTLFLPSLLLLASWWKIDTHTAFEKRKTARTKFGTYNHYQNESRQGKRQTDKPLARQTWNLTIKLPD